MFLQSVMENGVKSQCEICMCLTYFWQSKLALALKSNISLFFHLLLILHFRFLYETICFILLVSGRYILATAQYGLQRKSLSHSSTLEPSRFWFGKVYACVCWGKTSRGERTGLAQNPSDQPYRFEEARPCQWKVREHWIFIKTAWVRMLWYVEHWQLYELVKNITFVSVKSLEWFFHWHWKFKCLFRNRYQYTGQGSWRHESLTYWWRKPKYTGPLFDIKLTLPCIQYRWHDVIYERLCCKTYYFVKLLPSSVFQKYFFFQLHRNNTIIPCWSPFVLHT